MSIPFCMFQNKMKKKKQIYTVSVVAVVILLLLLLLMLLLLYSLLILVVVLPNYRSQSHSIWMSRMIVWCDGQSQSQKVFCIQQCVAVNIYNTALPSVSPRLSFSPIKYATVSSSTSSSTYPLTYNIIYMIEIDCTTHG